MNKLDRFKEWVRGLFTDNQWEATKEVCRWIVFLVVSEMATQLLNQAIKVPESLVVSVSVFSLVIPARAIFVTILTLILRYSDKLKHLNFKLLHPRSEKAGGILPW